MIKNFYYKLFQLSDIKMFEMQFYLSKMYFNGLDFSIEMFTDKSHFRLYLDLYLLKLDLGSSRRCDHHGITFYLSLFNVNFDFNKYDTRHWNDELNCYSND